MVWEEYFHIILIWQDINKNITTHQSFSLQLSFQRSCSAVPGHLHWQLTFRLMTLFVLFMWNTLKSCRWRWCAKSPDLLCVIQWTIARWAPLSMGSRQEQWGWVSMPSSRGSSETQGSNPHLLQLLYLQADSLLYICEAIDALRQ